MLCKRWRGRLSALEICAELKRGRERIDLVDLHRVVDVVRIAPLDAGERSLGQRGFDLHRRGGLCVGLGLGLAGEDKQLRQVGHVALANLFASCVGLGVVVAVGQAEAAGAEPTIIISAVLRILFRARIEEVQAAAVWRLRGERPQAACDR